MGNKVAKLVKLRAKEFNKKRKLLRTPGIILTLQIKDGEDNTYTNALVVTSAWLSSFDAFRQRITIKVATLDSGFEAALKVASDVAIGSDRYEINKRDIHRPDGERAWWEFYSIASEEVY